MTGICFEAAVLSVTVAAVVNGTAQECTEDETRLIDFKPGLWISGAGVASQMAPYFTLI